MPKFKVTKVTKLPKIISNDLRMTCILQVYSHLVTGHDKSKQQQHDEMFSFYHDRQPNCPIQIKMLCMGSLEYRDLYFAKQEVVTSDDATCSAALIIKP